MPKVMIETYSRFFDTVSNVQFNPVLDRRIGCYVGVAEVDKKTAKDYATRPAFTVLTDDEYLAMTTVPEALEPTEAQTGDPLSDQAQANADPADPNAPGAGDPLGAAPPPPASK